MREGSRLKQVWIVKVDPHCPWWSDLPYYYSNSCRSYQPKPWCKCTSRTSSESATSVGNLTSQNQLTTVYLEHTSGTYKFISLSMLSLYFHMSSITQPWYEMRSCPPEAPHLPRAYLWPKVIVPTSVGPGRPDKNHPPKNPREEVYEPTLKSKVICSLKIDGTHKYSLKMDGTTEFFSCTENWWNSQ